MVILQKAITLFQHIYLKNYTSEMCWDIGNYSMKNLIWILTKVSDVNDNQTLENRQQTFYCTQQS